MALKTMGIVSNYEDIRLKKVALVGVGGVGAVCAEMLARCGIGSLLLFDYDTVELANMNRLFFRPSQKGMKKVNAAKVTLNEINSDVSIDTFCFDITTTNNFTIFMEKIKDVDLMIGCVDNFAARAAINQAALELNLTWFETGVSENAVSGHVQLMKPGVNACFSCAPPLCVVGDGDESLLKRENVCAASLPTTMTIIAGFCCQAALKYLLDFGSVAPYIAYNALNDFLDSSLVIKASPDCQNKWCLERQEQHKAAMAKQQPPKEQAIITSNEEKNIHSSNEWGITNVKKGTKLEEASEKLDGDDDDEKEQSLSSSLSSLAQLQQQLKNIQSH